MKLRSQFILALLVTLLLISSPLVQAAEQGPQELAQYFPENTIIFAGMRTDEAFLNQIDTLTTLGMEELNAFGVPTSSLREALEAVLIEGGMSLEEIFAWMGGYTALGTADITDDAGEDSIQDLQIVIQITDKAAAQTFFQENIAANVTVEERGTFTVYAAPIENTYFAMSDSLLILTTAQDILDQALALANGDGAALAENSRFAASMDALSAHTYNIAAYFDLTAIQDVPATADLTEAAPIEIAGTLAAGFTIIDTYSLVADIAYLPDNGETLTTAIIDPAFARFFPENASAIVHTVDLASSINALFALADSTATDPNATPSMQLTQALAMFGIDLEADVLSWTDGNYGAFVYTDLMSILQAANMGDFTSMLDYLDMGIVIEATDPAAAQGFVKKLVGVINMMGAEMGVEISQGKVAGVEVAQIAIPLPIDPAIPLVLNINLGANDEIFFLGTANAVENILRGDSALTDNPNYRGASKLFLNNASSIWYTDGEGFVTVVGGTTVGLLAILGPVISNTFEDILSEFEGEAGVSLPQQEAQFQTVQFEDDPIGDIMEMLPVVLKFIHSTTISTTTTTDGSILIRMTISYQNQ